MASYAEISLAPDADNTLIGNDRILSRHTLPLAVGHPNPGVCAAHVLLECLTFLIRARYPRRLLCQVSPSLETRAALADVLHTYAR